MRFLFNKTTLIVEVLFVLGKECVAAYFGIKDCQVEFIGKRQRLCVHFSAACNEYILFSFQCFYSIRERGLHLNAMNKSGCEHSGSPAGKRCAEGLISFSSHQQGMTGCELLKPGKIFGNVPWQCTVHANDTMRSDRSNEDKFHARSSFDLPHLGWKPGGTNTERLEFLFDFFAFEIVLQGFTFRGQESIFPRGILGTFDVA